MRLAARADGRDPAASGLGEREVGACAEIDELVDVTGFVTLVRIRPESEEPSRETFLVPTERIDPAALLHDHAPCGQIPMVEPASPNSSVLLLAFRRVREERAEELAAALASKVNIGERYP